MADKLNAYIKSIDMARPTITLADLDPQIIATYHSD